MPDKIGPDFETALKKGDYETALKTLATYYRQKEKAPVKDLSAEGEYNIENAENYLKGIVRVVNIDWQFEGGRIDFLFNPTNLRKVINPEWLWQHNRHFEWRNLARAYSDTGDERYAKFFAKQLLKWILQTEIPENWNGIGSPFRTIECGLRLMHSWPVAFDSFRKSPSIDDYVLLLMIASMHRQSVHLVQNPTEKNWLMMESCGIYTFSSLFAEFSDSESNRKIASDRLVRQLEIQILPDGMHNELSPDYQMVVFNCAFNMYSIAVALGFSDELPENFASLLKSTVNAAILLSTPAFTQPRTNDCFTMSTESFTKKAASVFADTNEYKFVNTKRAEGAPPKGKTASAFLDYSGFVVMRSDYSENATYMCFDVGPLGEAHSHQDKLNINIYKGEQELIYDDGGGQYDNSPARKYARSGYGHNTVLVDNLAQKRTAPRSSQCAIDANFITNEIFDYASSVYDDTFGEQQLKPAIHKREVRFCKPEFFVVSDTLTSTDGALHDYEVLFHLDTTKVNPISEYKNAVISNFAKEYEIAIIPLDKAFCMLSTVSGAEGENIRGWYNGRNDKDLHKSTTVSRKAEKVKDFRFDTLLIPLKQGSDIPKIVKDQSGLVTVSLCDKDYTFDINNLNQQ